VTKLAVPEGEMRHEILDVAKEGWWGTRAVSKESGGTPKEEGMEGTARNQRNRSTEIKTKVYWGRGEHDDRVQFGKRGTGFPESQIMMKRGRTKEKKTWPGEGGQKKHHLAKGANT